MAQQAAKNPEVPTRELKGWVIPLLRLFAFSAFVSATVVMALNKQTKAFVVATIGSNPIKATVTAKFQHTPAFVFFVVANSVASMHNLLILAIQSIGRKYDFKGNRFAVIAISDMLTVALVSGGASGAAFMGYLGRKGNSHARWNKICDKFDTFCDHGAGAMIASFIGLVLLIIVNVISIIKLQNRSTANCSVVP
ncbi:hypothetical protein RJ639_037668 [Escallonia herrerae]|uniref:CASP-like protein n=1 Tax=Escallonia herrerae TaxID=1293975 RepID=A0AA88WM79_9ASTE|nr:hypothetical protein RJ639_037668 [Escallonia herrerae]